MAWVGVRHDFPPDTQWLRKAALFFDRIDLPSPWAFFRTASVPSAHPYSEEKLRRVLSEYDWLLRAKIIDLPFGPDTESLRLDDWIDISGHASWPPPSDDSFEGKLDRAGRRAARHWAGELQRDDATVVAITDDLQEFESSIQPGASSAAGNVIRVVMHEVPEPAEDTSWEQIIEFREAPDTRARIAALHRWVSDIATRGLDSARVADELRVLLRDYEEYMRLQKMKINKGIVETILTGTGEAAENLAKIRWGSLGKLPFIITHRRIQLLEAELNAPGREIGWVAGVRDWARRTHV